MKTRRFFLFGLLVLSLSQFFPYDSAAQQPNATAEATVTVGEPAPDFTLPTQDGEFTLSKQRGKNVVIVFVRAHW